MRALLSSILGFCSLALSGCSVVYSVHPLNTSDDAVDEPAITGTWSNDDAQLCVQKSDRSAYSLVVSPKDPKSDKGSKLVEAYQVTLVRLDDQLFADVVAKNQAFDGTEIEPPAGAIFHHVIVKLDVTDSDLSYTILDSSAVQEANKQGYASLEYLEVDNGILLTASTEDLRWAVSHHADRLFTDGEHYTRQPDNGAPDSSQAPCSAVPPS